MVQKIQPSEYLKRYDNMTSGERQAYEERVGEWLSVYGRALAMKGESFDARLQNVLQLSTGWNDTECQAFEDGVRLLSALAGKADTWLPDMLYVKSAKRAIKQMFELLWKVDAGSGESAEATEAPAAGKPKEDPAEGTAKETQGVGGKAAETYEVKAGGAAGVSPDVKPTTVTTAAPVRPKHIDQYVHLLPEKTQEHASQVQGLLRELEDAREKMRLLADDASAKDTDLEAWAKKATAIDNKLRKIYDELDGEWGKLVKSGRVVVDDLGNARVVPADSDAAAEEEPAGMTSEQKARRRELRKWLVDTRRGNGDSREEHVSKWKDGFREFLTFDGEAAFSDEKVKAAAAHYGIDMDEFREKPAEDQKPAEEAPVAEEKTAEESTAEEQKPAEETPAAEEAPAEEQKPAPEKKKAAGKQKKQ